MKTFFGVTSVVLLVAVAVFAGPVIAPQAANPPNNPPQTNTDFEISTTWFQLPPNMELGRPVAVAYHPNGSLFVLRQRVEPPIIVFTRSGKFIRGFGDGMFKAAHSIGVDREGFVWTTDNQDNVVYKFSVDGQLLMTLGKRGVTGDNASQDAFNRPSNVAVARNGDIFVTDGYGNSRIVKFTRDGKFAKIIGGTKGAEPGQFNLPHAILIDANGRLVVTDRLNDRIQIFDQDGKFIEQWTNIGIKQPSGLYISPDGEVYTNDNTGDAFVVLKDGKVIRRINGLGGRPHIFAVDPFGTLYIADAINNVVKRVSMK